MEENRNPFAPKPVMADAARSTCQNECSPAPVSAARAIRRRIEMLRHEIDTLESLEKFAVAMEGTPADEALWTMAMRRV